jgi:hypothetical protein
MDTTGHDVELIGRMRVGMEGNMRIIKWGFSRLFDIPLPVWADDLRTRVGERLPERWFDQADGSF